uniref:Ig-like domain-containing protein n=1 Tax=Amphilophus citrinellus TaxID=61819 RepID=A0A3Q0QYP0_AMPCI
MAYFTAALGAAILLGFIKLSVANEATCDLYAVPGHTLTLPFVFEGLTNLHIVKWTHNKKTVFNKQGRVTVGKPEDISSKGSLVLKKIQLSSEGIYQVDVLHPNHTSAKTWTGRLCVMDKVSKPQLSYVCDFRSMAVNLNCYVAKSKGLVFSWTRDEETLKNETKETLSISLMHLKGERSFTCSAANKVSKASSDKVRPTCPTLLSFTPKTVLAVLAGGAGLILFLLVIIIVLSCLLRRSKNQMSPTDVSELRTSCSTPALYTWLKFSVRPDLAGKLVSASWNNASFSPFLKKH